MAMEISRSPTKKLHHLLQESWKRKDEEREVMEGVKDCE